MSRTVKDGPFWLWQADRLNLSCPDPRGPWRTPGAPRPYRDGAAWHEWLAAWPLDPSIRSQKARQPGSRSERRLHEGRYRAYVRDRIRHGDYDLIEPPAHLSGYKDWWW